MRAIVCTAIAIICLTAFVAAESNEFDEGYSAALGTAIDEEVPEELLAQRSMMPRHLCSWRCHHKCAPAKCSVSVYKHCGFKGYRIHLGPGRWDLKTLQKKGMKNDDISSIRFHGRGCVARLYQHHHFGGKKLTKWRNDSCFTNDRMSLLQLGEIVVSEEAEADEDAETELVQVQHHRSFNDQVSSIKVNAGRRCHRKCHKVCRHNPHFYERNAKNEKRVKERVAKLRKQEKKRKEAFRKKREKMKKAHEKAVKKEKRDKEKVRKYHKEKAGKKEKRAKEHASKKKKREQMSKAEKKEKENAHKAAEKAKKAKAEKSKKETAKKEKKAKEHAKKESKKKESQAKAIEKADKKERRGKEKAIKHEREKAKKAEKRSKEIRHKEAVAAEKAHKAERRSKETTQKYTKARKFLLILQKQCEGTAARHLQAVVQYQKTLKLVIKAEVHANKVCDVQKKAMEKKAKAKKKIADAHLTGGVSAGGFKFRSQPCRSGGGSFNKKMIQGQRVNVGLIPALQYNVKVNLKTDKDVDAELWSANGKVAIVAWKCHTKGCIDSAFKKSTKYGDVKIKYSGYLGVVGQWGHQFGHEYIHIIGKSKNAFMMKAFAYQAGTAKITYSWDKDAKACALIKKEQKEKHDAKLAARKAHSFSFMKKVETALHKASSGCKGAKMALKVTKTSATKLKVDIKSTKTQLQKCHYSLSVHTKKVKKLAKKKSGAYTSRI